MKTITILNLLIVMLASCAGLSRPSPSPTNNNTPVIQKTISPTATRFSTSTVTATMNSPVGIIPKRQCLPVDDKPISLDQVTSSTILQSDSLLDLQTGKRYRLPFVVYQPIWRVDHRALETSPDRNHFAHIEPISNEQHELVSEILWVVNARAETIAKIALERTDLEQPRWLDNERLVFYTAQTNIDGTVLVINPFNGEQIIVSNELPRLTHSRHGETLMVWMVEYSPDMKWVVYLENNQAVTVYNILTKETLWNSPHSDLLNEPSWSPDGLQVAISGGLGGSFYIIDRLGQAKVIMSEDKERQTWAPSWSPDGRRIAFWSYSDGLMIYDQKTDQVVITCIQDILNAISPLRWSPDGSQLIAYAVAESVDGFGAAPILIDFQKNVVYTRLLNAQDINPDVWMNSLP